jgi:hypothetical protein
MTTVPCRLHDGIWLEDVDQVIPWGAKLADLRHLLSPDVKDRTTGVQLSWRSHVCLGFRCDIRACRIFERPNPRAYHIYLETLHAAFLNWHGDPEWSFDETTQAFRLAYAHVRERLGEATFSYPPLKHPRLTRRGDHLVPSIFWELPLLQLGLSATYPPHLADPEGNPLPAPDYPAARFTVSVVHEPPGYHKLKAEARSIVEREGQGARVNYVAW